VSVKEIYQYELDLEKDLRKTKWLIPTAGIFVSLVLISSVWLCSYLFNSGHWWVVFPAGLLAHSFFIIAVHDASHESITRSKADRWILNIASGLLLLPFFGEAFRNSHHIHHGNSNSENDPLWHNDKDFLFRNYRLLYVLCEFVPILFHAYLLFRSRKRRKERNIKVLKVNYWLILFAACISTGMIYFFHPSGWFFLGLILSLNFFSKIRHWCEHVGTDTKGSNNTFWYPMGLGIGNHDTHHYAPYISWLTLAFGLRRRKKNSNPFYALFGVLFRKDFIHYSEEGNIMGKN
jgi:fatty acid desaturase